MSYAKILERIIKAGREHQLYDWPNPWTKKAKRGKA